MGGDFRDPEKRLNSPTQRDGAARPQPEALSAAQQRLWVLERIHPRNSTHNVSYGLRLTGPLDPERFGHALRKVIQRYDILRTEFHSIEGVPQPVVLPSAPHLLNVVSMETVTSDEREPLLSKLAREEVRRTFDLSESPLLRATLWRLAPLEHVVLLVAHSIVCDRTSLEVLLR